MTVQQLAVEFNRRLAQQDPNAVVSGTIRVGVSSGPGKHNTVELFLDERERCGACGEETDDTGACEDEDCVGSDDGRKHW